MCVARLDERCKRALVSDSRVRQDDGGTGLWHFSAVRRRRSARLAEQQIMLRITVSERDRHGGDLTCMYVHAVAFGQRTGENHHTYGTLLQVSFATWAGLFFSVQSSTILLYLTLALVKGMLCLFTYTGPKIYQKLSYFDTS